MNRAPYRLIWFQHLHKAAGSTIVKLALLNGERLDPHHQNGNPADARGEMLPIWEYAPEQLKQFIDDCEARQITFVATEWGLPNVEFLATDPRVVLFTCIREPLERLRSNYQFDYLFGYSPHDNVRDFINSDKTHTMHNYYCRIFSRHYHDPAPIEERHYQSALRAVQCFDHALVLERADCMQSFARIFGWDKQLPERINSTFSYKRLLLYFMQGKWGMIRRFIALKSDKFDEPTRQWLTAENRWDLQLYQMICEPNRQAR